MSELIIRVDVKDVDPTREDPHEVADLVFDADQPVYTVQFLGAEWAKPVPPPMAGVCPPLDEKGA